MRTQSPETKLRHARVEARNLRMMIQSLQSELRQRKQCGQMMSNLCFNLAQNDSYDATTRQMMRDCREMWDKIRSVPL